jgi:predicted Zn-dependent protease
MKIIRNKNSISHCFIQYLLISLLFASSPILATQSNLPSTQELPTLGNASSNLISIEQEKKLGQAWLRALRRHTDAYSNTLVEDYLASLIYALAPNSNVVDRDFSAIIIDSPALNAFAVPGSIIGVNAGLFYHAYSEQEFASVIAHELAHLGQRHYARQLERQTKATPLALAGFLASVILAATTGSEAGMAALASTQALSVDQQLRFSRKNEQEADRLGIATMHASNFDPRAMPIMFERMFRKTRLKGENAIPEYLSTHPLSETRISDTRSRANQYPTEKYQDNIEFHFCKNMIISDYADSEKTAVEYFNAIIEKGNTTQIQAAQFGLAYASLKSKPERSISLLKALIEKHPNKISVISIYAKALQSNGDTKLAIKTLETLLKRNPGNYSVTDTLADIYLQNNLIKQSEGLLVKLSKTESKNPRVWYQLAEVHGLAGNIVDLHLARAEYFFLNNRLELAIEQLSFALKKSNLEQLTARIQKRMDELYELKNNPAF